MDVKDWQRRLRDFAAARDWQPYHAPKNLAMALMVEAAELMELFQWQTLTESRGFTREPQNRERVGEEMADVLLYLLQLADHCGVDLAQATERKFARNAEKHPAKRPAPMAQPEPSAAKVHLLVDWENVQPTGEALRALVPEGTDLWLFHGPQQRLDVGSHVAAYGAQGVTQVPRSGVGRNALDFQLSYYVGYISARQPRAAFVVVSNDQGYDPMLAHARELGFQARRVEYRRPAPPAPRLEPAAPPGPPALPPVGPARSAEPITKATRPEMQRLVRALAALPLARRPAHRAALLDWLQAQLGEIGAVSPRVEHALAQLRAQKHVVLKGDAVGYPAPAAVAPAQAVAPSAANQSAAPAVQKPRPQVVKATPVARAAAKQPLPATAAQILPRVLASLKKMPDNRPTRRAGLLKFIATHAGQAVDPPAAARQVLDLLLQKKHVALSPDGLRVSYPGRAAAQSVKAKRAGTG